MEAENVKATDVVTNEAVEEVVTDSTTNTTNENTETATDEVEVVDATVELTNEINKLKESLNDFEATKTELTTKTTLISEYEALLTDVINTKLADVSDEIKALMPSGSIKEQFDWIKKAESANLFKKPEVKPQVEIGKPIEVASAEKKVDTSRLTATQLMQMAYSSLKK